MTNQIPASLLLTSSDRHPGPRRTDGTVYLVGAGPGDPELLTLRAYRLLTATDVVIYDRLVGDAIVDLAPSGAERIFVGKARAGHAWMQDEINALMVARARAGSAVVRLKGGDPFVFGRGGEEVEYLRVAGLSVEIVPGITAATGCAAVSGIPLTHRDHASAVTFVTGRGRDGEPVLDWPALAGGHRTLVVYMGVAAADSISARLVGHGMAPDTPAAIVENGTLADQRIFTGTVGTLGAMVRDNSVDGPAVLIIGDVVPLAPAAAVHGAEPLAA